MNPFQVIFTAFTAMVIGSAMFTVTAGAQAPPSGGRTMLGDAPLQALVLQGKQIELGQAEVVSVAGQSFSQALRVTTRSLPSAEWNLQLQAKSLAPIRKGDVLLASFWLRCAESMTSQGFVGFNVELAVPDHDKAVERRLGAAAEWVQCFVPFVAPRDYAAGEASVNFRVGFEPQVVEIGDVQLINYGDAGPVKLEDLPRTRLTYSGREADAPWRKAAHDRINRLRKGDLTVSVADQSGRPVAGVRVRATLKRHAFRFGTCVTVEQLVGDSADALRAREFVERYCNYAVFENDMKWPAMWDGANAPALDRALAWLLERSIASRGHNLHWPSWRWCPKPLLAYEKDPAMLRQLCERRVTETVARFRGKLVAWDVVNEPWSNHDLTDILGREVLIDWFRLARQADPSCRLVLNDFGIFESNPNNEHHRHFYDTIQYLRDGGAPLDGIGIQSHFGVVLPPPQQLIDVLDRFGAFGLPIESTEVSFNVDDPALAAEYMRDYMTAVFSHPSVDGIMLWGFWAGRHWRPQAALYDRAWNLRPHGKAWIDLVDREWKTDVELTTDAAGVAQARGFLGEYEVTVTLNGTTRVLPATLTRDGARLDVRLD